MSNLLSNLLWCVAGILGGATFSFIFYLASLKRKKLSYHIKTVCLITDKASKVKGLEIKYNSESIDNLFYSTLYIKNKGNSIIEKHDFAEKRPLSLLTNGKFLVDSPKEVFLSTNSYLTAKLSFLNDTCNHISFTFDYIPKKEEIRISLFHTGDISFDGILKDGLIANEDWRR